MKILVVEDDADARLGFQVLLKANRYDIFLAADGMSAVSEARRHLSLIHISEPTRPY